MSTPIGGFMTEESRLQQMDAAGIDFQILSLFDPGVQDDTDAARAVDRLDPGRKTGHPGPRADVA